MLKMVGSSGSPLASITETPHSSLKYAARMCLRFGQKSIRSIPGPVHLPHLLDAYVGAGEAMPFAHFKSKRLHVPVVSPAIHFSRSLATWGLCLVNHPRATIFGKFPDL